MKNTNTRGLQGTRGCLVEDNVVYGTFGHAFYGDSGIFLYLIWPYQLIQIGISTITHFMATQAALGWNFATIWDLGSVKSPPYFAIFRYKLWESDQQIF